MIILVLNCGSSSLKYQLLDMKGDEVYDLMAKGLVERIGMDAGCIKHQTAGKDKYVREMPISESRNRRSSMKIADWSGSDG